MPKGQELLTQICEGSYDETFRKLYARDEETVTRQRDRYCQAIRAFENMFGSDREIRIYSAPGRTEIGGNHTDHNNGVVMAAAVNLDILAIVAKNDENVIRVHSQGFEGTDVVELNHLDVIAKEQGRSASLIRGMAAGIQKEGGVIGGFDAYTTSDVLRGSGLSSSAAFEVVIGAVLNGEYNANRFSAVKIAQLSQYAENVYFGKPSGLMDQTASSVGSAIMIDFQNPDAPIVDEIRFDLDKRGYHLCITDTKGSHADLTDDYTAIRREMESAAAFFGKKVLREVDENSFWTQIASLRQKVGDRAVLRAAHFFAECRRAGELRTAAAEDRFEDFLKLILMGGHSSFEYNQNAYSIRHPQQQGVSVGLVLSQHVLEGRGAWRLQGGGFAGTIQAFVPDDLLDVYRKTMENAFGQGVCRVLNVRNYGAIEVTQTL